MAKRTTIQGMGALEKRMDQLSDEIRDAAHEAIVEGAEQIRDDTSANVRHDSGDLSEGVEARYEDDGLTAQVGWFDDDLYYAEFAEGGTSRFPPQPSLEPAHEAEMERLPKRIEDKLQQAIK